MRLASWAIASPSSANGGRAAGGDEKRVEARYDCCGLKLIVRQRRALGIIHLRNLSSWGACGITDMPLAIGSLIFLELKRAHFYGARVKWVRNLTVGLQLARPMKPPTLERLLARATEPGKTDPAS